MDPDVLSGPRHLFGSPAEHFAGLRSGTLLSPKEDPGIAHVQTHVRRHREWDGGSTSALLSALSDPTNSQQSMRFDRNCLWYKR